MRVEHPRAGLDPAVAHEVDQRRHRLSLVDRVGQHPLEPGAEADRLDRLRVGDAVGAGVPLVEEHDLVVARARGRGRSPRPSGARSARSARASARPSPTRRCRARGAARSCAAKPAIIPACVEPVTEQTTTVSKKTPSSRSCSATSSAQRAKPRPPSGWSEAPAGIAYGLPPRASTSASACSQLGRKPMSKPGRVEPHLGAHDPREQDVPDLVVDGVRPVDPVLLHEHAAEAELRGDRRDLPRVVRLHAADRDERVASLRERVGREVLELAHLVAAVGEARVAVLPLRPDLDLRRRGARSAARAGAPATARRAAARGRSSRVPRR